MNWGQIEAKKDVILRMKHVKCIWNLPPSRRRPNFCYRKPNEIKRSVLKEGTVSFVSLLSQLSHTSE